MAKAVAFFLLINSSAVPELTEEFIKNNPVPPPLGVLAYNLVTDLLMDLTLDLNQKLIFHYYN
jgi:hypothetical protein